MVRRPCQRLLSMPPFAQSATMRDDLSEDWGIASKVRWAAYRVHIQETVFSVDQRDSMKPFASIGGVECRVELTCR